MGEVVALTVGPGGGEGIFPDGGTVGRGDVKGDIDGRRQVGETNLDVLVLDVDVGHGAEHVATLVLQVKGVSRVLDEVDESVVGGSGDDIAPAL